MTTQAEVKEAVTKALTAYAESKGKDVEVTSNAENMTHELRVSLVNYGTWFQIDGVDYLTKASYAAIWQRYSRFIHATGLRSKFGSFGMEAEDCVVTFYVNFYKQLEKVTFPTV